MTVPTVDEVTFDLRNRAAILTTMLERAEKEIDSLQKHINIPVSIWHGAGLHMIIYQAYEIANSVKQLEAAGEEAA